jgi:hypothetical protein
MYFATEGVVTSPFVVDSVLASKGRIMVKADAGPLQLIAANPLTGALTIQDFERVAKGEMLTVDVAAPYTLYALGGWVDGKPYETWGVFVRPEEAKLSLDAPERALPGAEIAVRLESSRAGHCLLLVYDARLEHEDPLPKLAERLFRHLKSGTEGLRSGAIAPLSATALRMIPGESGAVDLRDRLLTMTAAPNPVDAAGMPLFLRARSSLAMGPVAQPSALSKAFAGATAPDAEEVAVAASTARMDFPELVCVESFALDGVAERTVKLGEQIGLWRCRAYLFSGADYAEATHDIQTSKDVYVELDLPAFMSPGDDVHARASYHAPAGGVVIVQTATGAMKKNVQGDGRFDVRLRGPGEVVATLSSGLGDDVLSRVVAVPGRQTVTVSRLAILSAGETVEGEVVAAYAGMGMVIKDTIESLIQYPFG